VPELSFFIGKGGVGKTTVSCAYAMRQALNDPKRRVLLISTDPAHSLGDVLQARLSHKPSAIRLPGPGRLQAWQVNAEEMFRDFLVEYKEKILDVIDAGAIFSRQELEPLIDTTLPGLAEVAALLAVHDALNSRKYESIVVDTAPFGHTLRLFQLPEHFVRFTNFLELAASRDAVLAAHFGGGVTRIGGDFLARWRVMVEGIHRAFTKDARLVLVTTSEKFSLNESARCAAQLAEDDLPLEISAVVLNRAVIGALDCAICKKRAQATTAARGFLRKNFPGKEVLVGEDPGSPIFGTANLAAFAEHVFSGSRLQVNAPAPKSAEIKLKAVDWPTLDVPLSLVLGKGGVGKTTISAGMGFRTRSSATAAVEICSVDPAPSLDDIFQKSVGDRPEPVLGDPQFRASEMDSAALFKEWIHEIRSKIDEATGGEISGIHVDLSFERQLLSELLEVVPPGVDEVLAIFRIIDLVNGGSQRVVIDMAPTGHALELLRMPQQILAWTRPLLKTLAAHRTLALARDAAVSIAQLGQRVRELIGMLHDEHRAQIHVVMLAEPMPDRETARLMRQLQSQKLAPASLFVNRVSFEDDVGNCRRCRQAMLWQRATLSGLRRKYENTEIYVVRNFPDEIAGKPGLRSLTRKLWRLA
jgi:arsenite/tail-anchored protein-transporting ATPase